MNGYSWSVDLRCDTDGATSTVTGPWEYVALERTRWLVAHDRHEFTITTSIQRPTDIDVPVKAVSISTRSA